MLCCGPCGFGDVLLTFWSSPRPTKRCGVPESKLDPTEGLSSNGQRHAVASLISNHYLNALSSNLEPLGISEINSHVVVYSGSAYLLMFAW